MSLLGSICEPSRLHDEPPCLHYEPLQPSAVEAHNGGSLGSVFDFEADPDSVLHSDPDAASQKIMRVNADPV